MNSRRLAVPFLAWFLVGASLAIAVQTLRAEVAGGPAGLLTAGRLEPSHAIVLDQLPHAPILDDYGHDGQIFFAIGTDPLAFDVDESIISPYRYRRILFPALASLFGLLSGEQLLWGMIALNALAVGISSGVSGLLAGELRLPWLAPLAVSFNPGLWLSAAYLMADALAFCFGITAIYLFIRGKDPWAIASLAAASLTKETHYLFAVGLAGYLMANQLRARSLRYGILPLVPVAAWWAYVASSVGNPLVTADGIGLPLRGMLEALPVWQGTTPVELTLTIATLAGLVSAVMVIAFRRRLFAWLAAPWVVLALLATHGIWDLGNNSVRTLAPIVSLGILGLLHTEAADQSARAPADRSIVV